MNENYNDCRQRKRACTFLFIQKAKNWETFLYKKSKTLCKKQDNFYYVFIYKKQDTLSYAIFHENFGRGIHIQKA